MSRQQSILDFIIQHKQERDYSPTLREIGEGVGIASSATVHRYLERMEKQGVIKRLSGSARTIEVIQNEDETMATIMRRRVAIKVLEITSNGTFKKILIGGRTYSLDPMG